MSASKPEVGRLYKVCWEPTQTECTFYGQQWWNTREYIRSQQAEVLACGQAALGLPTFEGFGWWRVLVVFPPHARNFRRIVWVAPAQCSLIHIPRPIRVWRRPLCEHAAAAGALYSHELHRTSWPPHANNVYLFDCNPFPRGAWMDGAHSGFCALRVESLLHIEEFFIQVVAACLGWQQSRQDEMWCFCTHGKHRSQSARTIACILTGAHRGGRRPFVDGWCSCGEITAARLCEVLTHHA